MLFDEARIRSSELVNDTARIQLMAQLEEVKRLDRLQRSVRVVRARLGLPAGAAA
jgi:hypothetical protein